MVCMLTSNAQTLSPQTISSFGGTTKNSQVNFTWTSGEPMYTTEKNMNNILTQGFHQSFIVVDQSTDIKISIPDYTINVYPNPAQNHLFVLLKTEKQKQFDLQITDLCGVTHIIRKTQNEKERINLNHLPPGIYLLQISENHKIITTIKIEKNY